MSRSTEWAFLDLELRDGAHNLQEGRLNTGDVCLCGCVFVILKQGLVVRMLLI